MRLRIEPPEARRESYSGAAHQAVEPSRFLDLVLERQELANWCWAAIAASVSSFGGGQAKCQEEIASLLLGCDCTQFRTDPDAAERCNRRGMLDEALRLVGCYSHWSPGRPTFERISAEIAAGRPIGIGLDWQGGGSHYVLVTGYHADTRELYIQDPLHGPSLQAYDSFPIRYRVSGCVWRGTYWTQFPSPR